MWPVVARSGSALCAIATKFSAKWTVEVLETTGSQVCQSGHLPHAIFFRYEAVGMYVLTLA